MHNGRFTVWLARGCDAAVGRSAKDVAATAQTQHSNQLFSVDRKKTYARMNGLEIDGLRQRVAGAIFRWIPAHDNLPVYKPVDEKAENLGAALVDHIELVAPP